MTNKVPSFSSILLSPDLFLSRLMFKFQTMFFFLRLFFAMFIYSLHWLHCTNDIHYIFVAWKSTFKCKYAALQYFSHGSVVHSTTTYKCLLKNFLLRKCRCSLIVRCFDPSALCTQMLFLKSALWTSLTIITYNS